MKKQGIEVDFKTKGQTDHVEGVVFSKDELSFSDSLIDRSCSYSKLSFILQQNAKAHCIQKSAEAIEWGEPVGSSKNFIEELFDNDTPAVDVAELVFQRKLRNQANKKRKGRRL